MYKYLLLLGAVAASPAMASLAVVTCDGITTEAALTASCNGASVTAANEVYNDDWPVLDLNVGGYLASASFTGVYALYVSPQAPDGAVNGWFAPNHRAFQLGGCFDRLDGMTILPGQGTELMGFANGEAFFTVRVSGSQGASVEVLLNHFWDVSGHSITPDYELVSTTIPIPEPSSVALTSIGWLLILASRRLRRR